MELMEKMEKIPRHDGKKHDDIRIAVVEDDIMFRHALEYNLKKIPGNRVFGFDSGEECIRNYHRIEPEIMILDYRLSEKPGSMRMNGLELLQEVKSVRPETEVLFISGQDSMNVTAAAIQGGAAGYISKDHKAMDVLMDQVRSISLDVRLRKEDTKAAVNGVRFAAVLLVYIIVAFIAGFGSGSTQMKILIAACAIGIPAIFIIRQVKRARLKNLFKGLRSKNKEIWFD